MLEHHSSGTDSDSEDEEEFDIAVTESSGNAAKGAPSIAPSFEDAAESSKHVCPVGVVACWRNAAHITLSPWFV